MSIIVDNLSKSYGVQRAVQDLSFEVKPGEVMGFLGPNGAGKSTTMKMIMGIVSPDKGVVTVNGHDPRENPIVVRQKIGYLAESNPLYLDLFVREHLDCLAQMQKVPNRYQRVEQVIGMTGLKHECHKPVKQLSKGYRQRLGLAIALLNDPEVLILDEPTSGLDPNQLTEIRALIGELGREKCIILSTHIMQEVQAVCNRVLIINNGRKVLDEPIAFLDSVLANEKCIVVEFDREVITSELTGIPGVKRVKAEGRNTYVVWSQQEPDIRSELFHWAVMNNLVILEMKSDTKSVEDIFQSITKTA